MSIPQENSDLQINSFLETEFFFYLIPCYFGVVAFIYRYYAIIDRDPLFYIKKITGEWLVKYVQSEQEKSRVSEALTYKVLPASYVIKSKLSLYNSYLYLFMIFLSLVSTSSMFYGANHKPQSFLYLFGFLAWYLSALVLRREQQRGMPQSIWIHRLFWILAGTFSSAKMFEDYFLPLNLILNLLFIATIYAIYRPQDTETLDMGYNDDIPSFIKFFFQSLEVNYHLAKLNSTIRWLLKIEDAVNQNFDGNNKEFEDTNTGEIDLQDLKTIQKSFQHTAENIKEQINLLQTLPRRNIFIDKKLKYVKVNERFKTCYFTLAQIGNNRFQSERTFEQFQRLDTILSQIFSTKNFPKFNFPRISEIMMKANNIARWNNRDTAAVDSEHSNKAQFLEQWLHQVTKTPIFMVKQFLDFLNVDEQNSAPFLIYYQYSYKLFCSKNFLLQKHKIKKNQQRQRNSTRRSLVAYYDKEGQTQKTVSMTTIESIKCKLYFKVQNNPEFTETANGQLTYQYIVTCQPEKKPKIKWTLTKIQENILSINQKIQEECQCSIPFYYSTISTLTKKNHSKKQQAYRQYIENLLQDRKYYCPSLFMFVRFNPVTLQIMAGNAITLITEPAAQQRNSHYFEDYEDKGGFIEVLRVKKVEQKQNSFNFKVRRGQLTLNNKSIQQLSQLKSKLIKIYKGVSTIPEIDCTKSTKQEIKNKIQTFLLKIQNLPKIQINKDYLKFYESQMII